ncbi:Glutamate carboxypeptidase 2, partial [Bulinus truncatus]
MPIHKNRSAVCTFVPHLTIHRNSSAVCTCCTSSAHPQEQLSCVYMLYLICQSTGTAQLCVHVVPHLPIHRNSSVVCTCCTSSAHPQELLSCVYMLYLIGPSTGTAQLCVRLCLICPSTGTAQLCVHVVPHLPIHRNSSVVCTCCTSSAHPQEQLRCVYMLYLIGPSTGTAQLCVHVVPERTMNSSEELHSDGYYRRNDRRLPLNKVRLALFLLLAAVIGLAIGLLVGKFALCDEEDREGVFLPGVPDRLVSDEDLDISDLIMKAIDPAKIESNLRDLTKHPHIAGRSRDFELVSYLQKHFRDNGLHVQTTPYDVLLSYPNEATPNSVRLVDGSGNILYDAKSNESDISGEPDVVPPFNAYSPSKLVEGELVFANYGRVEDFEELVSLKVNVTGRVVIVKYGKMFRGDKVDIAASYGATGIIIYSDPADYTGFKSGDYRVYPDTWWLPSTGVQRGTVFTGDGDPLTPGYPANNLAFRYTEEEVDPPLPKIPAHPIGYGAATEILKHLNGTPVSGWAGGLNVSYNTGPGFIRSDMKIQLNVTTKNQRAKAENVFDIIRGTVEPDRYVLIGNHRDAWIYGAIDPSSGTAVIMELVRVIGSLVKSGRWKPRRSIVFCSWGAEEFGLIGSTEWVE